MENDTDYLAALAEYLDLDRATVDREWREVLQCSADRVLGSLEPAERARLLEYLGRFSPSSAAFIVKEFAEVHALAPTPARKSRRSTTSPAYAAATPYLRRGRRKANVRATRPRK